MILAYLAKNTTIFDKIGIYVDGLLTKAKRKTCVQMASSLLISHDILQRILGRNVQQSEKLMHLLLNQVKQYQTHQNPGYLIIDDTCVAKPYGKTMHGLEFVYSSLLGRTIKGYSYLFLAWTNGKITIPIKFAQSIPKDLCEEGAYRTKGKIAQELISGIQGYAPCKIILLDGLYQSQSMMAFLDENRFEFYMRLPRNRTVSIAFDEKSIMLKKHKYFRLQRNQRSKTWRGFIKGRTYYITAEKRKMKNEDYETVYIVSNRRHHSPKTIIAIYEMRWYIEKFFRTAKQSLGLQECQVRSIKKHEVHLAAVCIAYVHLEEVKIQENLDSAEKALKVLQKLKSNKEAQPKPSAGEYFHAVA